nr:MAG TPA: hypothetical protein [Caudoviricetes sp.]
MFSAFSLWCKQYNPISLNMCYTKLFLLINNKHLMNINNI